jgi:hypothetical protein
LFKKQYFTSIQTICFRARIHSNMSSVSNLSQMQVLVSMRSIANKEDFIVIEDIKRGKSLLLYKHILNSIDFYTLTQIQDLIQEKFFYSL